MAGLIDPAFWSGKRVLLTGHTGFKGVWCALLLKNLQAEVFGISLEPNTTPNLFDLALRAGDLKSSFADIRDPAAFLKVREWAPEIVIHMAAQPLVRRAYAEPQYTFEVNTMGTVHLLEALRGLSSAEAILVVTTDKVYKNDDKGRAFSEVDPLGGRDPYSASKAAAELATSSYAQSFFEPLGVPVATARAGNVIGGGDWSENRIIPDIWRAARADRSVTLRMPGATRPWQHVVEPVVGYLAYCQNLVRAPDSTPRALNFGPPPNDTLTVSEVTTLFMQSLGSQAGWDLAEGSQLHEMKLLSLDPNAAAQALGWRTKLDARSALELTSEWYRAFNNAENMLGVTLGQITDYLKR